MPLLALCHAAPVGHMSELSREVDLSCKLFGSGSFLIFRRAKYYQPSSMLEPNTSFYLFIVSGVHENRYPGHISGKTGMYCGVYRIPIPGLALEEYIDCPRYLLGKIHHLILQKDLTGRNTSYYPQRYTVTRQEKC